MVFVALYVAGCICKNKTKRDTADNHVCDVKGEQAHHREDCPETAKQILARPKHAFVNFILVGILPHRLKMPRLFSLFVDCAPPPQPDQDPINFKNRRFTYLPVTFLTVQKSKAINVSTKM